MPIEIPKSPVPAPFVVPPNRERVTSEPYADPQHHDPRYPDVSWDHHPGLHGGGHVPEDFSWPSNPKQRQDELMGEWIHG